MSRTQLSHIAILVALFAITGCAERNEPSADTHTVPDSADTGELVPPTADSIIARDTALIPG